MNGTDYPPANHFNYNSTPLAEANSFGFYLSFAADLRKVQHCVETAV